MRDFPGHTRKNEKFDKMSDLGDDNFWRNVLTKEQALTNINMIKA